MGEETAAAMAVMTTGGGGNVTMASTQATVAMAGRLRRQRRRAPMAMATMMTCFGGYGDIECNGYCANGDKCRKVYGDGDSDGNGAAIAATVTVGGVGCYFGGGMGTVIFGYFSLFYLTFECNALRGAPG